MCVTVSKQHGNSGKGKVDMLGSSQGIERRRNLKTSKIYTIQKGEQNEKYRYHDRPYMYREHLGDWMKWKLASIFHKREK